MNQRIHRSQILEVRNFLAGNVLVSLSGADLVVTGDDASNQVDVVVDGGNIVVRGRENTTINGGTTAFVAATGSTTLTDDFFARLGSGDDVLFVEGISIRGRVFVAGQSGNDSVGFLDTDLTRFVGIVTGGGSDVVNLDGVQAQGGVAIHSGRNDDIVRVANSTISGNTLIAAGRHSDAVVLENTDVSRNLRIATAGGADHVVTSDSTVGGRFATVTGRGNDFVMLDNLSVARHARVKTQGQHDIAVIENASRFGSLKLLGGAGRDSVQVATDTVVGGRRRVRGQENNNVSEADREQGLNDPVSGALTLATAASDFFAALASSTTSNTLTVSASSAPSNAAIQSDGTLIASDSSFALQVATQPGATVSVDANGDGQFNEGTATADAGGTATLNLNLQQFATAQGRNDLTLSVQASNGTDAAVTDQLDVYLAEGTVVRFDTSLGSWDIALFDQDAPNTVAAFLQNLSRYDGSIIHRNVSDFIIQGGGFDVTGTTVQNVTSFPAPPNEFNAVTPPNSNLRGTLSTAQNSNINSFTGQWFINTIDNDATSPINNLDNVPHTVFGEVIGTGMTVVDAINNTPVFNISGLLTGTGASALTNVPLVNYTAGTIPTAANYITVNSVTRLTPVADVNTFNVFENSTAGTSVGTVTAAVTGSPVIYQFANSSQATQLNLHADDHLEGDLSAPVVVVEYLSLQCPHCADAHPLLEQLLTDNSGDVIVVRRHLPLDTATGGIFEHSFEAALAAEAAGRQGQFDAMVAQLFSRQSEWTNAVTSAAAQAVFEDIAVNTLGLNLTQFNADIADPVLTARINRDISDAAALGVTSTPTFFVNGTLTAATPTTNNIQTALQAQNPTFNLDRRSGALSVVNSNALDFELTPTFLLNITATGTNTVSVPATINVIDVFTM
ncbi:MAG: thioredoxin domain-containing protein [Planctomycetaceae bacterium]|nr:thioredoxin domain-containing protein [Planctomycetaceae bacterium]